jgi:hypothetical protein
MEQFRDIKGYEGLYQVSNLGRVKSLSRVVVRGDGRNHSVKESFKSLHTSKTGYTTVSLTKEGKTINHTLHQLLAIAFLGHEPNGFKVVVDHIDGNPLNNKLENLQLITNRENTSKDKKNKTSKYTGVHWDKKAKKWRSRIQVKGKYLHLGCFDCELEASKKYQEELGKLKSNC